MPGFSLDIKIGTPLHERIRNGVRDRIQYSKNKVDTFHDKWTKAEEAALAYMPERDVDAARRTEREGGKPQYTTITLPYTYGILMASHTYWTTVFLARTPILQFSARHGEPMQQVQAVEALLDYQVQVGGMIVPLYIWLMDVGKYGLGVTGEYWEERNETVAQIEEVDQQVFGIPTGRKKKVKTTRQIQGYHGNRLYNIRPFDFFPDPRVALSRFQEGEFCGVYNELGWNTILRRTAVGLYSEDNVKRVKARKGGRGDRIEGSSQLVLPDSDSIFSDFTSRRTSDVVKVYETYIDLIPTAWGLGKGTMPEKWVFTVTSDYEIVLGAQPLGAYHNKFPISIIEFEPEGYALINRGVPEILKPVQDTLDWLINSHFYNVRKSLNNQWLVDPSRVVMQDVLDPLPGGIIRSRPNAYSEDVRTMLSQLPVTDVTRANLSDMQTMFEVGQRATGVNDQMLGLVESRGRRTAQEVRTTTTFGINRLKTAAEYFSAMGFTPMSSRLLQNTQQYYDLERQFRIVGDLATTAGPKFAQVTPESIQGFYDFVPVDGTLPADRFAQAQLWRALLGEMRQMPELMQQYDVGRIFAWVAQLAGLKNINQFKINLQPDAAVADQAQRGNIVPLGRASEAQSDLGRVPDPTRLEGLGATG